MTMPLWVYWHVALLRVSRTTWRFLASCITPPPITYSHQIWRCVETADPLCGDKSHGLLYRLAAAVRRGPRQTNQKVEEAAGTQGQTRPLQDTPTSWTGSQKRRDVQHVASGGWPNINQFCFSFAFVWLMLTVGTAAGLILHGSSYLVFMPSLGFWPHTFFPPDYISGVIWKAELLTKMGRLAPCFWLRVQPPPRCWTRCRFLIPTLAAEVGMFPN